MARLTIPDEQTFATFTVVTSTTVFPITFSLFAKADLTVLVDNVALNQSAFTFTGTLLEGGGYDGGTVTLNTAVDDVTVRIERNVAPARTSNFAPASSVPVQSVDQALNRLTANAQDHSRRLGEAETALDDFADDVTDTAAAAAAALAAETNAETAASTATTKAAEAAASAITANTTGLPALPQFQRLIANLGNGTQDTAVVLVGDSTGNETTEWYYLLLVAIAALYPAITFKYAVWNDGTIAYDASTTVTTGSGARTCTFYNASISGTVASRHAGSTFGVAIVTPNPDALFISYGHNGSTTGPRQLDFFDSLASRLQTEIPETPVVQIGQNPTLSDETMAAKIAVLRPLASRKGWGFISVHDAFKQAGVPLSTLMADSVHPNAAGSALWRDTVLAAFRASRAAYGSGSIVSSELLASWSHPLEFAEWTKTNVTLSQDTTNFETLGKSAALACTAPGVAYISRTVVTGDDIIAVRGRWVTFWVVQRVPSGNDSSSGRIELIDSGGTTTAVGVQQGTGFQIFSVRKKIDTSATTLTAYIYPSATAGVTNTIQVDRAGLALGLSPVEFLPVNAFAARSLRVMGGGANGIGVFHNSFTAASGLRFIATDTADVSSAWTTDVCADGLSVKQAADAQPRTRIGQDGLFVGLGTVTPTLRLRARFSDTWGSTGHFDPETDNLYDCGQLTLAWRRVTAYEYRDGAGTKLLGTRGAAVADATGGAVVDTEARAALNALLARLRTHGLIAT